MTAGEKFTAIDNKTYIRFGVSNCSKNAEPSKLLNPPFSEGNKIVKRCPIVDRAVRFGRTHVANYFKCLSDCEFKQNV